MRTGAAIAAAAILLLGARPARAVDVGHVKGEPVQLDVTETTIVAQHFDARTPPNEAYPTPQAFTDSGWGSWLNRLNASLRWDRITAGLRLDSAVYWDRPIDNKGEAFYEQVAPKLVGLDNESRFKNSIYPAKVWVTYAAPGVEVTAGDAYVQFGRGLTLSMRKIDELGIDTTVRGGKVQITRDPYSLTAVAGFANPSRVDEATGRALWVTSNLQGSDVATPVYGSDRVVGLDFQAGRGLPVTLSSHLVHFTRCAPFAFGPGGAASDYGAEQTTFTFGTCDGADTDAWLRQRLNDVPLGLQAEDITMGGQSVEIPTLWGHGKLYVEGAVQQRQGPVASATGNGNALYAALTLNFGPTSTTIEGKSNRNFYTVAGSVSSAAPELSLIAYTFLPPAESFNMIDAEGTGDFNACVEGIRVREDVSVTSDLLVYGQGIAAYSLTEQPNGRCDEMGRTQVSFGLPAASVQDTAWDGVTGFEYTFDHELSHVFVSTGARNDTRADAQFQYLEQHAEYSVAKYLGGPWSIEVQGRYRHRREYGFNQDPMDPTQYQWWTEGENYISVRIVPRWVFTQGFEATNLIGQPFLYFNGAVTYKLTSSSNVRVFVGQQRGAFRCASGVCRYFPPFEGARAELTLRF
ncbi:MAG: DUF6029 family protein [Polyangiaceae bacterium]